MCHGNSGLYFNELDYIHFLILLEIKRYILLLPYSGDYIAGFFQVMEELAILLNVTSVVVALPAKPL